MAGRRSDHDKIDPGPFSSPHDVNVTDEKLRVQAKQDYKQTLADEKEELIPRRGVNPALADLKARREAAQAAEQGGQHGHQHGQQHDGHDHHGTQDPAARATDAEATE